MTLMPWLWHSTLSKMFWRPTCVPKIKFLGQVLKAFKVTMWTAHTLFAPITVTLNWWSDIQIWTTYSENILHAKTEVPRSMLSKVTAQRGHTQTDWMHYHASFAGDKSDCSTCAQLTYCYLQVAQLWQKAHNESVILRGWVMLRLNFRLNWRVTFRANNYRLLDRGMVMHATNLLQKFSHKETL